MASAPRATGIDAWKTAGRAAHVDLREAQAAGDGDRLSQSSDRVASDRWSAADGRDCRRHAEGRRAPVRRRHVRRSRRRPDRVDQRKSRPHQERSLQGLGGRKSGYAVAFGEGDAPWKRIFEAVEKSGGVEYYLIEQETGGPDGELAMVRHCLDNWKKLRA